MKSTAALVLDPQPVSPTQLPMIGTLVDIDADGRLTVQLDGGHAIDCACLETGARLALGDRVLVSLLGNAAGGVVLGRIGRYQPVLAAETVIEASQSLSLRCGEASLTLRADGKVLLKGDDVVVRAKGTQRIRAGHVAIN